MKIIIFCAAILSIILAGITAQAQAPFVLYDNFNQGFIDPQNWYGNEWTLGTGVRATESLREIGRGALHMSNCVYNFADSLNVTGYSWGGNRLIIPQARDIIGIKATVQVAAIEAEKTVCGENLLPTIARARVAGKFFNYDGAEWHDVFAFISIQRQSDSGNKDSILEVVGEVYQCSNGACAPSTLLGHVDLGQIIIGRRTDLSIQWDKNAKSFIFQLGRSQPMSIIYALNDNYPPYEDFKALDINHRIPNCGNQSTPVAAIEAYFDDIYVQRSANP